MKSVRHVIKEKQLSKMYIKVTMDRTYSIFYKIINRFNGADKLFTLYHMYHNADRYKDSR